tara:strand:+ start:30 stop:875 length:846 start_codon:yes stop_codon:yes gene_type:complete
MAFYGSDPRPGDNILALLEPGEYVMNRNAARKHKDELEYMNEESAPRYEDGMQMGGNVRGSLLGEYLGLAEDIPKLQSGGQTLSQGSGTTALPLLSDIYKQMGIQPVEEQMGKFQEYDASREDVLFGDYSRQVAAERAAGQQGMSAAYQASLGMGKGFSGFGGREQGMGQARQGILKDFLSQKAGAESTLFKQVRGEREAYMTDIASQMRALQGEGGTEEYGAGATEATYTAPSETTGQTAPPGWPTSNAYDQWRQAGSDPNTATNYGWQAVNPGDTPGYK